MFSSFRIITHQLKTIRSVGSVANIADPTRLFPHSPYVAEVERRVLAGEINAVLEEFETKRKNHPESITHEEWEAMLAACVSAKRPFEATRLYDEASKNGYFRGLDYMPEDPIGSLLQTFDSSSDFSSSAIHISRQDADLRKQLLKDAAAASPVASSKPAPSGAQVVEELQQFFTLSGDEAADRFRTFYDPKQFSAEQNAAFEQYARQFADLPADSQASLVNLLQAYFSTQSPLSPQAHAAEQSAEHARHVAASKLFSALTAAEQAEQLRVIDADHASRVQAIEKATPLFNMLKYHVPHAQDPSKDSNELWNSRWEFLQSHADKYAREQPNFFETTDIERLINFLRLFHDKATMVPLRHRYIDLVIRQFGNQPLDWFLCSSLGLTPAGFFKNPTLRDDSLLKSIESATPIQAIQYLSELIHQQSQSGNYY